MAFFNSVISFFMSAILTVLSLFIPSAGERINDYEFTVDASQTGGILANPASNVNIWSIEGNPFVGARCRNRSRRWADPYIPHTRSQMPECGSIRSKA